MESAFRWCVGILAMAAFQVGCCRIELNSGSGFPGATHSIRASSKPLHSPGCGCSSCDSQVISTSNGCSDGCDDACGIHGTQAIFDGSWCGALRRGLCRCGTKLACQGGCGEIYWDEQINEPPVCDPCGAQGAWIGGGSTGHYRPWYARMRDLWGYRYEGADCEDCTHGWKGHGGLRQGIPAHSFQSADSSGCASCNHGSERVLYEGESVVPQHTERQIPTPAQPRSVPTPDANAHNSSPRTTSPAVQARGTARGTIKTHLASGKMPLKVRAADVDESEIAVPKPLTVETVNGQKRLVPRHR